jgi:RimJ/RimL family protein N-acetyltransferase
MNFTYVPLLQIQRELQGLPRNYARFRQYLRTISPDGETLELPPLGIMNPMGKDHVTALLDALLKLDADSIVAQVLAESSPLLANDAGDFKVALVIADDLMGGWTNRYDYEFNLRFGQSPIAGNRARPKWLKDLWLTAILWSSESATERGVREAVVTVVYRTLYVLRNGPPRTLHDMLLQEGHVMREAGCTAPVLDEEDIAYTREVLGPFLDVKDKRTCIECLFGDAAGRTLGFTPRGLSPWAGLALALHDAKRNPKQTTISRDVQQLDPDAIRMACFPARCRDEFMAHWAKIMPDATTILKTILVDGRVAGNIVSWEQSGQRKVGYWLGKEYWGKGIASEALAQFLVQVTVRPLVAHVAKQNRASLRVLQKCGFTLTGEDTFPCYDGEVGEEFILALGLSSHADL